MNGMQKIGVVLFVAAFALFTGLIFVGSYQLTAPQANALAREKGWEGTAFMQQVKQEMEGKEYAFSWSMGSDVIQLLHTTNETHKQQEEWDKVIWDDPSQVALEFTRTAAAGPVRGHPLLFFCLTFLLGMAGALLIILGNGWHRSSPGIKNNGVYQNPVTARGWVAWLLLLWLAGFYILVYFKPCIVVNWVILVQPVKDLFVHAPASQWFLYGLLYTVVVVVMGIRMLLKYRGNNYQLIRTGSVMFFQVVFAFLLVEILPLFNLPATDLKNAWPLDYDFLFDWNVKAHLQSGNIGKFMFFWGIALSLVAIPVLAYFYGKRWYCSWVCGCGGLAETLGDPFRQHSGKKLISWKIERWMVHSVLLFAVIMTVWTGYQTYNELQNPGMQGGDVLLGISAFDMRSWYGFLIGSMFAGVIGTGFYPIFGNRVWCRFGCPLAAYLGVIQRFKSRFRITTNGGQCISCGNCSTYCEQGIDVRWYAQRGQNIVRASCVGCGVCSAVCPRGVLKLENGPEEGRINDNPILIGNNEAKLNV